MHLLTVRIHPCLSKYLISGFSAESFICWNFFLPTYIDLFNAMASTTSTTIKMSHLIGYWFMTEWTKEPMNDWQTQWIWTKAIWFSSPTLYRTAITYLPTVGLQLYFLFDSVVFIRPQIIFPLTSLGFPMVGVFPWGWGSWRVCVCVFWHQLFLISNTVKCSSLQYTTVGYHLGYRAALTVTGV